MSPKKATQKSASKGSASDKPSKGFTAEEREAMRERRGKAWRAGEEGRRLRIDLSGHCSGR